MEGIDWHRMFIGEEPPMFLLEIVIRTIVIYSYTLILLRLLGSRAIGQLDGGIPAGHRAGVRGRGRNVLS